jgi:PPK2 family polyphosphate:nucleotide phosphotransferase
MNIDISQFLVNEGKKADIAGRPTKIAKLYSDKAHYKDILHEYVDNLRPLQKLLYASDNWSVLMIFQGMDAAGKDGCIRAVMSGVNPQGCEVYNFKQPSSNELDHDFLWRTSRRMPMRGRIGIFNRSYYEEVLVVKVHPELLRGQRLPEELIESGNIWQERYESILNLEKHLARNGTKILKFYLHLSKDEQKKRFLSRIENSEKNWKFSMADIRERQYWDEYMDAFESCISETSTAHAPWYCIPADNKRNARLIVSQIFLNTLASLDMEYPITDEKRRLELEAIREQLLGEEN